MSCPKAVFDGVPEAKGQTLAEVNGFELDGLLFIMRRMVDRSDMANLLQIHFHKTGLFFKQLLVSGHSLELLP